MKNIPSPKLNDEPIVISLSGVGFDQIKRGIGFRAFFWENLIGTGASEAEINVIADAVEKEQVIFVPSPTGESRQGFINGRLIETPTQHVEFFGACVSTKSTKERDGRRGETLEEMIEMTEMTPYSLLKEIVEIRQSWEDPDFNAWLREVLQMADENPDYDSGRVLHSQRAVVFRVKDGVTPQSWSYVRVEYKPTS